MKPMEILQHKTDHSEFGKRIMDELSAVVESTVRLVPELKDQAAQHGETTKDSVAMVFCLGVRHTLEVLSRNN